MTCTCEGSEADCKSSVGKPSKLKGYSGVTGSGVVKFFSTEKGFGFIQDKSSTREYFFHMNAVYSELAMTKPGQTVTFDVEEGRKGLNAVNVKVE